MSSSETPNAPLATGAHRHGIEVSLDPTGDERLGTVDDVTVALELGPGLERGHVGATGRLTDRECDDPVPRDHIGGDALLQRFVGEVDHRGQSDRMGVEGRGHPARPP